MMDNISDEVTLADLERHSQKHGRKATSQLLTILGRRKPLYDMVMSSGGQMMFSSLLTRLDELLDKIVSNKASEEDLLEYKISVDFLKHNTKLLSNYKKHKDMLKGVK